MNTPLSSPFQPPFSRILLPLPHTFLRKPSSSNPDLNYTFHSPTNPETSLLAIATSPLFFLSLFNPQWKYRSNMLMKPLLFVMFYPTPLVLSFPIQSQWQNISNMLTKPLLFAMFFTHPLPPFVPSFSI